jgi:hypothetical protein
MKYPLYMELECLIDNNTFPEKQKEIIKKIGS